MAIVVRCECGKKWKLPDESAGKTVSCPACRARLSIPSPENPRAQAGNQGSRSAAVCPSCGGELRAEAVLCVQCGFDRRTGRRAAAAETPSSASKPGGQYPQTGLTLVYWGSRFGFGLITATLGLGLIVVGLFGDRPGVDTNDMALMVVLGLIFAAIGMQVGAKGSRIDWSREDEDELEFEELVLARAAPSLSGLLVGGVWTTGRLDILFNNLLPLGLVGCTTAVILGLTLCFVMSSGGAQKLLALGSALGYAGGAVLVLFATRHEFSLGLAVLSAALGEVFFLLWLRELGRHLEFEAAVAHVMRLLLFVAIGSAGVALLALLLSGPIQAALKFPPTFTIGAFSFYLCAVLYLATAMMWRLHITRALLDEIEVSHGGSTL
jgi:hypothetical protein